MLIEDPHPETWRDLQRAVVRIFGEVGLEAETEKRVDTPRGTVELDVFAVDRGAVEQVRYAVECKNWIAAVPQSAVHAFTTVVHEVGAHIGLIVTRTGLQPGAIRYTRHTNIEGLTFEKLQERYRRVWIDRYFVPTIDREVDSLSRYVEPFSPLRNEFISELSESGTARFRELYEKYGMFGCLASMYQSPRFGGDLPPQLEPENAASSLGLALGDTDSFRTMQMRDLLNGVCAVIFEATEAFNEVFGKDIFAEYYR